VDTEILHTLTSGFIKVNICNGAINPGLMNGVGMPVEPDGLTFEMAVGFGGIF
jgi:hypothetical protein